MQRRFALLRADLRHAREVRELFRARHGLRITVVVVEPGQSGGGVLLRRGRIRRGLLTGHRHPLRGIRDGDEAPARVALVPGVEAVGVVVDLLPHEASRGESHVRALDPRWRMKHLGSGAAPGPVPGEDRLVALRLHGVGDDLDAAVLRDAGDLFLDRVALAEGHGDELADHALLHAVAVDPGLLGQHDVVLRIPVEVIRPAVAADGAHLPGRDLHGEGVLGIAEVGVEADPHRLRLVHRHEDAPAAKPLGRQAGLVVVHVPEGEVAQAGREGIRRVVVRDAQRALKRDGTFRALVDLGKPEVQAVAFQGDHLSSLLVSFVIVARPRLPPPVVSPPLPLPVTSPRPAPRARLGESRRPAPP